MAHHLIVSMFAMLILAQGESGDFIAPQAARAPVDPVVIASLVADLESPECAVRDTASVTLTEMGPECYAPLREAFHRTRYYEVRRRIRQIALEIYLSERFGPPRAFLGISHRGMPVVESQDPRIPGWATALLITDVFKASSAQKAGLQSGDLVTALNGQPATLEYQALEFTRWISEQTPGTRCELTVLRGGRGVKLMAQSRSPFQPGVFTQAKYETRTHAEDPRVPPGAGAILLTDITGVPIEVDVREGDLILAIDEERLPEESADDIFALWARSEWKGRGMAVTQGRQQMPGMRIQIGEQETLRTAQILRGGEGLNLSVALGRWPTYLADQALGVPRAGGGGHREQVIESFGSWWRESFDPDGLFAERAEYDPDWQLKPGWKAP